MHSGWWVDSIHWIVLAREEISQNIGHRYGFGTKGEERERRRAAEEINQCNGSAQLRGEKLQLGADWKITSCHTSKFQWIVVRPQHSLPLWLADIEQHRHQKL